jgi:hypothetical protein
MEGHVSKCSWWYKGASSVVTSFATAYVGEGSKGDTYTAIGDTRATLRLIERMAEGACRTKSLQ